MPRTSSSVTPPSSAVFDGFEDYANQDLKSESRSNRVFQGLDDGDYVSHMTIKVSDTSKKNPKTPSTIVTFRHQLADDPSQCHDVKLWFNHKDDPKSKEDPEKYARNKAKANKTLVATLQSLGVNTGVKGKSPMACIKEAQLLCNPFATVGINVWNPPDQSQENAEKYGPNVRVIEVFPMTQVANDDEGFDDDEPPFDDEEPIEDEDYDGDDEDEEPEAPVSRKTRSKTTATPPSRRR